MRKIFTLFILLLLLPVTALAAAEGAPSQLYVGDQQVSSGNDITYWTTDKSTGGLTKYEGNDDNWNVKYDPTTVTLTLSGATIQGGTNTGSAPYGAGIYAQCSNGQSVTLTIELIGTNTITGTFGIYVNAEINASSYGTNATLTIMGDNNGSLEVSGSNHGIFVKSGTGNASLNIKNVAVTSSTNDNYAAGVYVMSSNYATNSPNISLSVDGGSLTASGTGSRDGILFYVGSSQATGATTSLTVSENAIVDAKNGGISAKQTSNPINTDISATGSSGGIVFNGNTGTVYGDVELQEDLDIGEGESLTIGDGASLNTGSHEVIVNGGTLTGEVNGQQSPQITTPPQSQIVTEGESATFTIEASGSEPLSYQWQESTDSGSNWKSIAGATSTSYEIATTSTDMSDHQYRCVVTASGVSVVSDAATLTVNAPTTYTISADVDPAGAGTVKVNGSGTSATVEANSDVTLTATANEGYRFTGWTSSDGGTFTDASSESTTFTMPANDVIVTAGFEQYYPVTSITLDKSELFLYTGNSETLTATIEPDNATNKNVTWSSDNEAVATVDNGKVTAVKEGTATITVTAQDGSGVSASCSVTVTHNMVHTPKKDATCTEDGNIEYWYCKNCDKYFSDENATEELSDVVIPATGHHYVNGYCTKCGHRDPDYRPDPISYYNIYIEDVCDGVEVSTSKNVVREGGSVSVYVKKDTANYTFDNFKVYYKRSYYGTWDELKEGTQPGEYPIKNIWTHIYIKAEGAEEKEDPTGIESIEGVKVYTKDGSLYVQTPQREQVIIVSMTGAVVKNEEQVGLKQYHGLQPGIYVVRIGEKAYKLRLH